MSEETTGGRLVQRRGWALIALILGLGCLGSLYFPLVRLGSRKHASQKTWKQAGTNHSFVAASAFSQAENATTDVFHKKASNSSSIRQRVTILLDRRGNNPVKFRESDGYAVHMPHTYSLLASGMWETFGIVAKNDIYYNWTLMYTNFDRKRFDTQVAPLVQPPCLLVSRHASHTLKIRHQHLPFCHVFLTGDEYCDHADPPDIPEIPDTSIDLRQYYSQESNSIYLPLGPRFEFVYTWKEQQTTNNTLMLGRRRWLFNAIFSENTSPSRSLLKKVLEEDSYLLDLEQSNQSFVHVAKWRSHLDQTQVSAQDYQDVLTHSTFTLVPWGHNPESYRLWEALWAQSIPILAWEPQTANTTAQEDDDEYWNHSCIHGLKPILESNPHLVFVSNWTELPAKLEELQAWTPEYLKEQQRALAAWSKTFWATKWTELSHILAQPRQTSSR